MGIPLALLTVSVLLVRSAETADHGDIRQLLAQVACAGCCCNMRLAAALEGVAVRDHRVFAGKLNKRTLGLGERLIANVVQAPDGDFRDRAYAIATALQVSTVPGV